MTHQGWDVQLTVYAARDWRTSPSRSGPRTRSSAARRGDDAVAGGAAGGVGGGAVMDRVRIALERLMDHMGVRTRRKDNYGKYADLSLHRRIDLFQAGEPVIGAQVMALKWLGNTGSHQGQVDRNDLLDAFEILEHVLGELIERRTAKVAQLARELNKKHAPARKPPRRGR
jgi:Domain of unknown function (DUF4145)